MIRTAEIFDAAIVVVGEFYPAMISPDWLEKNELIGKDDADFSREEAKDQFVITREITLFGTKWFSIQVLENQMTISSKGAVSPALRDLAIGIMTLLQYQPVIAVGINFIAHYKFNEINDLYKFGDVLAPKSIWNSFYPEDKMYTGLESMTIRIQNGKRGEPVILNDEKRIIVQSSPKIKNGVALSYNDHHELRTNEGIIDKNAGQVVSILENYWELAWNDSMRVFDGIFSQVFDKA